jgi:hypothetical protein
MTESLDQLLAHAESSFGLAILTDNPHRLHIALQQRIREARKVHPEAFNSLSILSSKSPMEIYIVNRQTAGAPSGATLDSPQHDDPDGTARVAVLSLPAVRDAVEGSQETTGIPQAEG